LDPSVRATTRTLTPVTLANPSHNSRVPRVHLPNQAITQEMSFRATTQRICSEPQLKEHSSKPTFKVSPKPCKSHTSKATKHKSCLCIIAWCYSRAARQNSLPDHIAEASCCQALNTSSATTLTYIAWWDDPHR